MDPHQHNSTIDPPPVNKVLWRARRGPDIDCRYANFQGVESYFTNSLLYKDAHEALDGSTAEPYGSGNEADS